MHGHAMAVGHAEGDFARAALAAFAGAEDSEALMLVADLSRLDFDPEEVLVAGSGRRLDVVDVAGAYDAFQNEDADKLLHDWDAVLDEILAAGHTGLRVFADNTAMLAGSSQTTERWLRWEQQTDAWQARRPISGTCFIDAQLVSDELVSCAARVHPAVSGSNTPRWSLHHGYVAGRIRLVLSGDVEVWDAPALDAVLTREADIRSCAPDDGQPCEIDVSNVRYLHHTPLRSLAALDPRGVRLVGAPTIVRRLMAALPTVSGIELT